MSKLRITAQTKVLLWDKDKAALMDERGMLIHPEELEELSEMCRTQYEWMNLHSEEVRIARNRADFKHYLEYCPGARSVGFIYFAQNESGLVKIGFSKKPEGRARALRLSLLTYVSGTMAHEIALHLYFKDHQEIQASYVDGRNEFFRITTAQIYEGVNLVTNSQEEEG